MDYTTKDNPVLSHYECDGQMSLSDYVADTKKDEETPRAVDTRDSIRAVTDNKFIVAKNLSKLSLKARKLLYLALSQCKKNDRQFYTFEISAIEYAELIGVSRQRVYQTADDVTSELMGTFIECKSKEQKRFAKYALFSKCEYTQDAMIIFKLNPDMTNLLLGLKQSFTQPLLADFMKMRSVYSMAIWHLMQREMRSKKPNPVKLRGEDNTISFDLSLEELRVVTGTENKLKKVGHFKEKVLDKAIKEIYDNQLADISYTNIKRGRTITGFHFIARPLVCYDEEKYRSSLSEEKRHLFDLRMEKADLHHKKSVKGYLTSSEELRLEQIEDELSAVKEQGDE